MADHEDKVFSPESLSDPRADRKARVDLDKVQNPLAREVYPGGAGSAEQVAQATAKSKPSKSNG